MIKRQSLTVKRIQDLLKKYGVKMSAIEIRELMRTIGLTDDETFIKSYVKKLRHGAY
jgi:transposase